MKQDPVNTAILGAAAEHFVMCQLLRQDMIAALAPAGVPNTDIIVSDKLGSRLAAVQVKARRDIGTDGGWHMGEKHTKPELISDLLFYCFVDFGKGLHDAPRCWVVPSMVVAKVLKESHEIWLGRPGKGGAVHKDSNVRRFVPDYGRYGMVEVEGWLDPYREAWHLIKGTAAEPLTSS